MTTGGQLPLLGLVASLEGTPRASEPRKLPPLTKAEKIAQREAQGHRCATCGGVSKGGNALDVIRGAGGRLIALCRRHRLQADAPERCRRAASWRRGVKKKRKTAPGQARMGVVW